MKINTYLVIIIIFLWGCSSLESNKNKYIKYIGRKGKGSTRYPVYMAFDGGSRVIPFTDMNDNTVWLILDRSIRFKNNEEKRGHLYWGKKNFGKGIKLDYNSDLAYEILRIMEADKIDEDGYDSWLDQFIGKMKIERNK